MFWQQLIQALSDVLPGLCMLLLLHFMRRAIGTQMLHCSLSALLIFSILEGLPNFALEMQLPYTSDGFSFGATTFSVFTTLLLLYEIHGTAEAQKVIFGLFITLIITGVFVSLILSNLSIPILTYIPTQLHFIRFIANIKQCSAILVITHLIFIISLPIVYQSLRNFRCPVSISLFICNGLVLTGREMDILFFFPAATDEHVASVWLIRGITIAITSIIGAGYLKLIPVRNLETRKAFSIVTSLFHYLQSTDKLRQSMTEWAEKFLAVLNHSSELIFLVTPSGNVINANPAALRILGSRLDGHPNLADFLVDRNHVPFTPPKSPLPHSWEDPTQEQAIMFTNMIILPMPPAPPLEVDFNLTSATINGDPVFVLIARDMTKHREQERKQQELQEQLYHAQRLESLGLLAGGVAHDFNNLLHSIQGSTELIRRSQKHPETLTLLDNIDDATARASKVTQQLLGFARKGNFNMELLPAESLVEQTARLFKPIAGSIAFKTLVEPGDLFIYGDSLQLQQVLLNLLINAKDAFAPDASAPRITLRAEHLRENTPEALHQPSPKDNSKTYICFKVKDNASGIPEDVLKHVFEPFFTTKAIGKGTGMGLAMAYGCVSSCKGWIHVETAVGMGTEFSIVLPEADNT